MLRGLRRRGHTAGRPHHERLRKSCVLAGGGNGTQVAGGDGTEVRVRSRRRGALVLTEFRYELVGRDDVDVRQAASQLVRDRALVCRMTVRVQETNGDRFGVDLRKRFELELAQLAARIRALAQAEAALEWHERLRLRLAQPVEVRARLPTQMQQMLEAGRRDKRGPRAFSLKQRIGR